MKKQNKKLKRPTKQKTSLLRQKLRRTRFLPALAISIFATTLWAQPHLSSIAATTGNGNVLAKATNISQSGLLSATNTQRNANGADSLTLNGQLNSAAQAKANDMVAKGYWAHVTPDGKQPWWFITNAGYKYLAAGENLAYGFVNSESTVSGWMNSTTGHRENMLNTTYTEVGFGFADTDDYVYDGASHGPQTIVVAMYAKPQVAAAAAPTPAPTQPKTTAPKAAAAPAPTPAPAEETTVEQEPVAEEAPVQEEPIAVDEDEQVMAAAPTNVNRMQLLAGTSAFLSSGLVILAVCASVGLWLLHKGFHLRRYVLAGEHFIAHHVHLDLTVLSVVYLGFVLLSAAGTIK